MNVSTTIPVTIQIRRSRLLTLVAIVAAVAAGITWAVYASAVDTGSANGQRSVLSRSAVLSSLTPSERRHVEAITALTPAQLRAAFGTSSVDSIDALGLTPQEAKHVRAITSMMPVQLIAAFGTDSQAAAVLSTLTPRERQHVEAIMALTPEQLAAGAAGFGTGK